MLEFMNTDDWWALEVYEKLALLLLYHHKNENGVVENPHTVLQGTAAQEERFDSFKCLKEFEAMGIIMRDSAGVTVCLCEG